MIHNFFPDESADSAYKIDYKSLYNRGYRGILFDIDNTLVEHGKDADDKAVKLILDLNKLGFKVCFISNNSEERVKRFNKDLHQSYIYKAGKPGRSGYLKGVKTLGTTLSNTVFIGDQLFTDIYGARRAGLKSIFVNPIGKDIEIQIILKRYLEKLVLFFYNHSHTKKRK
ncbi:YqeG family HAD IIIA-type phosphatase [Anaerocolumna chitinilytica]|uniref:Haloacid dehalogenase n=1 Tax=Anaerocolumna chitinilytica TaxID=1727145 RepID=A0A7I8DQT6_9FIRM|nr:HAD-IIIA family hydrolase [Anaerocolumna chitinilytica]BCJ99455.1 haloacid dehalogenase [Anaerocolumna chitinilytica]